HEPDWLDVERPRERSVLALGIGDPRHAPKERLPIEVALDQRGLARADLARDEQVRVAHDPALIEHERVVREGRSVDVGADQYAAIAQAVLAEERIDRLCVGGGRPVPGPLCETLPHNNVRLALRPRATGSAPLTNPESCSPHSGTSSRYD